MSHSMSINERIRHATDCGVSDVKGVLHSEIEAAGGDPAALDDTELAAIADDTFWETVASHFPETTSGDSESGRDSVKMIQDALGPVVDSADADALDRRSLIETLHPLVAQWVANNVTGREEH